jgi:hypothetical protein
MRRMNSGTGWRFTSRSRPAQLAEGTAHTMTGATAPPSTSSSRAVPAPRTRSPCTSARKQRSPLMRSQDLSDEHQPNGFAGIARQAARDAGPLVAR